MQDKDKNAKLTFKYVFNEWIEKRDIRDITKQNYKRHIKHFLAKFGIHSYKILLKAIL